MMGFIRRFGLFWYDFVVGDDWTVAVGVVIALAGTALLAHANVPAWWLVPAAAGILLIASLLRAARSARNTPPD
jgi:hypothetical protein